jgi:hypothetical protein
MQERSTGHHYALAALGDRIRLVNERCEGVSADFGLVVFCFLAGWRTYCLSQTAV